MGLYLEPGFIFGIDSQTFFFSRWSGPIPRETRSDYTPLSVISDFYMGLTHYGILGLNLGYSRPPITWKSRLASLLPKPPTTMLAAGRSLWTRYVAARYHSTKFPEFSTWCERSSWPRGWQVISLSLSQPSLWYWYETSVRLQIFLSIAKRKPWIIV